jgi:hypothetical protein
VGELNNVLFIKAYAPGPPLAVSRSEGQLGLFAAAAAAAEALHGNFGFANTTANCCGATNTT